MWYGKRSIQKSSMAVTTSCLCVSAMLVWHQDSQRKSVIWDSVRVRKASLHHMLKFDAPAIHSDVAKQDMPALRQTNKRAEMPLILHTHQTQLIRKCSQLACLTSCISCPNASSVCAGGEVRGSRCRHCEDHSAGAASMHRLSVQVKKCVDQGADMVRITVQGLPQCIVCLCR